MADPEVDEIVSSVVISVQREDRAVPSFDIRRQPDPVIGGSVFRTEDDDPPLSGPVTIAQRLDEPVPNHAVPDHHNRFRRHAGTAALSLVGAAVTSRVLGIRT